MKSVKNLNSSVYYNGHYWNDIPQIQDYICANLTGNKDKDWITHIKEEYFTKPFKHALFLNCGDGRWEREFYDQQLIQSATAFDISPDLIKLAKKAKGKRKIKYNIADANKIRFKRNTFDLVVNMAALHHVQFINKLCYEISKSLTKNGLFVSFDFVGPQRNQYPFVNWLIIRSINYFLPSNVKKNNIGYPHLPTMLTTDPTEAIHSDLINSSIKRYFKIIEKKDTNGGIAYEIFTHNNNLFSKNINNRSIKNAINKVLITDKLFTKLKLVPVFFSLTIAKTKNIPNKKQIYLHFQKKENLRENFSTKNSNIYTFSDIIKNIFWTKSWRKRINIIKSIYHLLKYKIFNLYLSFMFVI